MIISRPSLKWGVDMRFSVLLVVGVAAFFAVAGPALVSPAIADDVCDRGTGEASIAACTRIIQDGRTSTENRAKR